MRKLSFDEIKTKNLSGINSDEESRHPVYVIAHNIRSLFNVGSIFRTSDALRVKKLYLTGYTAHPPRDEIEKVALGSTVTVPWEHRDDIFEVIDILKNNHVSVIALEHTDESRDFQQYNYNFPVGIILGNEYDGLPGDVVEKLNLAVEIPMYGKKQSLNVATSFGVIGYELIRQLKQKGISHDS